MAFRRLLFILLIILPSLFAYSQDFPSEIWHKGKVVLEDGDTLAGNIKYDFDNDLIQLSQNTLVKTYSARKILYFEIFDETANSFRYFYSLPYKIHGNYEVPILFEVLYEGKLSLLSREQIVTEIPTTVCAPDEDIAIHEALNETPFRNRELLELVKGPYDLTAQEWFYKICQNTWEDGCPGVIFLDTIRKFHNGEYFNPVSSTNPCHRGNSLVHTDRGLGSRSNTSIWPFTSRPARASPLPR